MTTLTDRYVHAVLRAVPSSQRVDLEPEIRALVADTIDARAADGATSGASAELAAITELGDPTVLAARYADLQHYLIGPTVYPEWKRLLALLLPTVVTIVSAVVLATNLLSNQTIGASISAAVGTGLAVALQTAFWLTVVFAVIERVSGGTAVPERSWTADDLPDLPDAGSLGPVEFASSLAANVFVAVGLLWVQVQPPIVLDGESFALFDPALSLLLPWFLGVMVLEILLTIALYVRGRWTYPYAIVNALLGAAFAIPAVYLLRNDLLLNPALVAKVAAATGDGRWIEIAAVITGAVVVAVVSWDALDGFRKARRAGAPRGA